MSALFTGPIVGLDADCRQVAVGVFHEGRWWSTEYLRTNQRNRFADCYATRIEALFQRCQVQGARVWVEDTYLATGKQRNVVAFKSLNRVQGELVYLAHKYRVPCKLVLATEWQTGLFGFSAPRDALKSAAMAKAQSLTGRSDLTEHEADALCLAYWGTLERGEQLGLEDQAPARSAAAC
jgi:hypothetical protein